MIPRLSNQGESTVALATSYRGGADEGDCNRDLGGLRGGSRREDQRNRGQQNRDRPGIRGKDLPFSTQLRRVATSHSMPFFSEKVSEVT
jgi:hypothetical protein